MEIDQALQIDGEKIRQVFFSLINQTKPQQTSEILLNGLEKLDQATPEEILYLGFLLGGFRKWEPQKSIDLPPGLVELQDKIQKLVEVLSQQKKQEALVTLDTIIKNLKVPSKVRRKDRFRS